MPQEALIGAVAGLIRGQPLAHWRMLLEGVDCCFQPVLEPAEVPDDPQVQARGLVRSEPGSEPRVEVLFPALFDGAPPVARRALDEKAVEDVVLAWGAE